MPRRTDISFILIMGAFLGGCANSGWKSLQEEFPEVRDNCSLRAVLLQRDATDKRLLRLVFLQRSNVALQARLDGSLACVEHWARERGWRLTTGPGGEGVLMDHTASLLAALLVSACTGGEPAAPRDARAERLANLTKMTERCGVPERTLTLIGPAEVTIQAGPDVEWGKVECLIYEIRKAKPKLQYMFMGNAPYDTGNQQ